MTLAQFTSIPLTTTGQWVVGLIGALGIAALVLYVVASAKKTFGRVPPFHEELDKRDKAIRRQLYAVEKNLLVAHESNVKRMSEIERRYEELQLDRERKWMQLHEQLSAVRVDVAFIRGNCKQCNGSNHEPS